MGSFVAEEVGKSAKELFNSTITEKLLKMSGVVRVKPPSGLVSTNKGYSGNIWTDAGKWTDKQLEKIMPESGQVGDFLPSAWEGFIKGGDSLWVRRDVELELRSIQDIPKMAHGWYNKWFMTPWKIGKVMLRPAAWMRNGLSNWALNGLGGLPMYRVDIYNNAIRGMMGSNDKFLGTSLSQHWDRYKKIVGAGQTFSLNDVANYSKSMEYSATMQDKLLSKFHAMAKPGVAIYSA
jgi:hypothetical protein